MNFYYYEYIYKYLFNIYLNYFKFDFDYKLNYFLFFIDDFKFVFGKQKDIFEDILEDRRYFSDVKWAWYVRDVFLYKYSKVRFLEEIKKYVIQSDRVKYVIEQVSDYIVCIYMNIYS